MDKDSFTVHVKADGTYKDIMEDDETNYVLDRSLLKRKRKKVICVMKDEIDENIIKEFAELRPNTYSQLINDDTKAKKAKSTKRCVIKRKLISENYRNRLEAAELKNRKNYQEKKNYCGQSKKR